MQIPSGLSAPLFISMNLPKVDDIPAGATLRPGAMILEISTPPMFGAAGDETRFFKFPVYPVGSSRLPTPENTRAAFDFLLATSAHACGAVAQLAELSRCERARSAASSFAKNESRRVREYAAGSKGR